MKICFNETLDSSNLENDLELCEKYGYDYMEIRLAYLHDYLEKHSMDELKKYFDTHHIKPYGYNSITDVNFASPEKWDEIKKEFLFACEAAKKLGGKSIVIVPTCSKEMLNKTDKEIFDDSVKVLKELSELAKPYDVMLGFEPIGNKPFCVRSTKQALDIVNEVGADNVGVSVDACNMYAYNGFKDMDEIGKIPGNKICVLHINDAKDVTFETFDIMEHRTYPGDGIIDLDRFMKIVKGTGYSDVASIELFGSWMYEGDPEDVIRDGYYKTKAYLEKIGMA